MARFGFLATRFGVGLRLTRRNARNGRRLRGLPAEEGDADHADIVGAAGARGIRIAQRREVEGRDFAEALAPSADVESLPGRKDVAALSCLCRVAAQDVDAIDRHDREQILSAAIAKADLVFVARPADDVGAAFVPIDRQLPAHGAVVDHDVRVMTHGLRG